MRKLAIPLVLLMCACSQPKPFDPASVADATPSQLSRVEPLSWWTGMKTDLQLMVQGPGIGSAKVRVE